MTLRAALLDMDGTIFDSSIDFLALRQAMGLPRDGRPILQQLEGATPDVRSRALELLHEAERRGAQAGSLIPGTERLLALLRTHRVQVALITNNSRTSVDTVLRRFPLEFDLTLCREDGATKPAPDLFHRALESLDVPPEEAMAIGDTHLDCQAAFGAGIAHIVLIGLPDWMLAHIPTGAACRHVSDLDAACLAVAEVLGDSDSAG